MVVTQIEDGEGKIRLQGLKSYGCHADGDGDDDGDGDQAANTVRSNEIRLQGIMVSKNNLYVQNQQHAISREIAHMKCCNWSSQRWNRAFRNCI